MEKPYVRVTLEQNDNITHSSVTKTWYKEEDDLFPSLSSFLASFIVDCPDINLKQLCRALIIENPSTVPDIEAAIAEARGEG
jgi:hypothetical protein